MSSFEIPANQSSSFELIAARGDVLYFVGRSQRTAELIRTDSSGRPLGLTFIPHNAWQVVVDDAGYVTALTRSRGINRLIRFTPTGVEESDRPIAGRIYRVATVDNKLIGWDAGLIRWSFEAPNEIAVASAVDTPSFAVPLPGGRLAIVGAERPVLWVIGPNGGVVSQASLTAPELNPIPPTQDGVRYLSIHSIASNSDGEIFCAVSPYHGIQGGIVLQFDTQGVLRGRFRIILPEFPETKGRTHGRMLFSNIAVTGRTLFVGSRTERRCALYNLR